MARPPGIPDSVWRAAIEGEGWTPGAAGGGGGSAGSVTPTQVMGLIAQGLAAGGQLFSTIYGAINGVDPVTGLVSTQSGNVPPGQLGNITSTGGSGGGPPVDLNVDVEEEGFFDQPTNIALVMGGALLLLLVVMQR